MEAELEGGSGRSWWLVPLVIVVAVIAVLAGIYLVEHYFPGYHSPVSPPPQTIGQVSDLCNLSLGSNCAGHSFMLPATSGGGTVNTTPCDIIPSLGTNEQLWLNVTVDGQTSVEAVALPVPLYSGGSLSWEVTPWALLANTTAVQSAAWHQAVSSGADSYVVPIPSSRPNWCLGWWQPTGSTQVTYDSDLTLTYDGLRAV